MHILRNGLRSLLLLLLLNCDCRLFPTLSPPLLISVLLYTKIISRGRLWLFKFESNHNDKSSFYTFFSVFLFLLFFSWIVPKNNKFEFFIIQNPDFDSHRYVYSLSFYPHFILFFCLIQVVHFSWFHLLNETIAFYMKDIRVSTKRNMYVLSCFCIIWIFMVFVASFSSLLRHT